MNVVSLNLNISLDFIDSLETKCNVPRDTGHQVLLAKILKQGIPEDVKLRRTTLTFVEAETVQN